MEERHVLVAVAVVETIYFLVEDQQQQHHHMVDEHPIGKDKVLLVQDFLRLGMVNLLVVVRVQEHLVTV
jgi:hypothetical protein